MVAWTRTVPEEMEKEAQMAFAFWRHRNLTHDFGFWVRNEHLVRYCV